MPKKIGLKSLCWRLAVKTCSALPGFIRRISCRLYFAAASEKGTSGLRELFSLDEDLKWHIDRAAIEYENGIHPKHRLTDYHLFFCDRVQADEHVLDIGCGNGALAFSLAKTGALITAVDINKELIDSASSTYRHPNLTFARMDIISSNPGGKFDTIIMSNVLEHIEDRIGLLKSITRINEPRRWLIRVPLFDRHWSVPLKKELGMKYFSDPTHCTEYTLDTYKSEMTAGGLHIVHLQVNWGEIWSEAVPNA